MSVDPADFWISRISDRGTYMFKRWDHHKKMYDLACRRWGRKDQRTKWYKWRFDKIDFRDRSFNSVEHKMLNQLFDDPKFKHLESAMREFRNASSKSLKESRRKFGTTYPRK